MTDNKISNLKIFSEALSGSASVSADPLKEEDLRKIISLRAKNLASDLKNKTGEAMATLKMITGFSQDLSSDSAALNKVILKQRAV